MPSCVVLVPRQSRERKVIPSSSIGPTMSAMATASRKPVQLEQLTPDPYEAQHFPPHRTRVLQWVPSDNRQLAKTERMMLASISDVVQQRCVAGLNTIYHTSPSHTRTLVLIHGFAGGVANWMPNWRELTNHMNVYAVDLPGFARSFRPQGQQFASEEEAICFMVDAIFAWVQEIGLEGTSFDICGHSFGGYVAMQFALRYPKQITHLVLADPWGVPPATDRKLPLKFRIILKLFYFGNPLSILRGAGPFGPSLLPKVRKDFADRWAPYLEDPKVFYDYVFHCNAHGDPVGERAFQACCTGPVYAKRPLVQCVQQLDPSISLVAIYGDSTWMDTSAGREMIDAFGELGGRAGMSMVSNAGHQVNSDSPDVFNATLLGALSI